MSERVRLKHDPELARAHKNARNRAYYGRAKTRLAPRYRVWNADNVEYRKQWMRDMRAAKRC